ncbi:hypothetical protein SAMN05428938_4176 [Streptomyces sp. KS_5]|nr:hypothetical protein SAMN05428938_4176 [Streptomyces sp. KS_5]
MPASACGCWVRVRAAPAGVWWVGAASGGVRPRSGGCCTSEGRRPLTPAAAGGHPPTRPLAAVRDCGCAAVRHLPALQPEPSVSPHCTAPSKRWPAPFSPSDIRGRHFAIPNPTHPLELHPSTPVRNASVGRVIRARSCHPAPPARWSSTLRRRCAMLRLVGSSGRGLAIPPHPPGGVPPFDAGAQCFGWSGHQGEVLPSRPTRPVEFHPSTPVRNASVGRVIRARSCHPEPPPTRWGRAFRRGCRPFGLAG